MKKLSILTLAAAGMLMASCSQEDLVGPAAGGDGNFNITVKLPSDLSTRALGDGYTANKLQYAVYVVNDDNTLTYSFADEADFGYSLQTTLSLNLITGKQYQLAFFAQSTQSVTDGVYTFSPSNLEGATPKITVAYDKMTSASNAADAYDCFFKLTDTYTVGQEANPYEVVLTRPVAQINWGTSELGENNEIDVTFGDEGQYIQTTMQVSGTVYSQFNILDQDVEPSSVTSLTLGSPEPFGVPEETPFPVDPDTYDYVAVQYVLVPSTGTTYDLMLNIYNGANGGPKDQNIGINVPNAPVQANYRTNIYGNLLSTNATFLVEKQDFFAGVNNMPLAWDGTTVTYPTASADGNTYTATKASDLAGIIDMVNGTNGQTKETFEGKTIVLTSDVDMGGHNFEGIGQASRSGSSASGNAFMGVFDGQGNTIKNIKISNSDASGSSAVGFIGNLAGSTAALKDVTFENVEIDGGVAEQAGIVGIVTDGATVSGVNVTSGSVTSAEAAGGIVGRVLISGTIKDCTNGATVSSTKHNVGGIVGAAYYTKDAQSVMTISGCTNNGTINGLYGVGGVAGLSAANVENCNNNGTVTGTQSSVGGIVGEQKAAGSIKGCNNSGDVTVTTGNGTDNYGAAGIVGWVRYATSGESAAYPYQSPIEVSGCTNTGKHITGVTGVGGIVGMWFAAGTCTGNRNDADSISATGNFAAGIIGGSQWIVDSYPDAIKNGTLTVTGNTSTTEDTAITAGGCAATIVYVNNSNQTTVSSNTPENYNLPK